MSTPPAQTARPWRRWDGSHVQPDSARVLGKGGEANVCVLREAPDLVAKLYHRPVLSRRERIHDMLRSPPIASGAPDGHVSLAWPVDGIDGPDGSFAGFLMPRLASRITIGALLVPSRRREEWPDITWAHLVRIARNVSHVADAIHAAGHVIGDINDGNILVTRQALISWVDCDSFQIARSGGAGVHFCQVGVPEFLAPELQGADLSRTVRTAEQDRFSLALLFFRLLMEGQHPFSGRWTGAGDPPSPPEAIARGLYAFAGMQGGLQPAKIAPALTNLPPRIRDMFHAAFLRGISRPEARPSAAAWCEAFAEMETELLQCSAGPRHRYASHLEACPWCGRAAQFRGLDPFPAPGWTAPAELAPPPPVPQQARHGRVYPPRPGARGMRQRQPGRGQSAARVRVPRQPNAIPPAAAAASLAQLAALTGTGVPTRPGKVAAASAAPASAGNVQSWRTTVIVSLCALGIVIVLGIAWVHSRQRRAAVASAEATPTVFSAPPPVSVDPPLEPFPELIAPSPRPSAAIVPQLSVPPPGPAPASAPDPLQCPWNAALRLDSETSQYLQNADGSAELPLGDWAMEFAAANLDAATVGTPVSVSFAGWSDARRALLWRVEIAPPAEKTVRLPWFALFRPGQGWQPLSPRQRHAYDWKVVAHSENALNLGRRTPPVEVFLRLLEQINAGDVPGLAATYSAQRSGDVSAAWGQMRSQWPLLRADPVSAMKITEITPQSWQAEVRVRLTGESADSTIWQERIEHWELSFIRERAGLRISRHLRSTAVEVSDGSGNALPDIRSDAAGRPLR